MAIAVDQRFNDGGGGGNTTETIPNVVVSQVSPLLVGVYWDTAATVTSVVYNGTETLSLIGEATATSGTNLHASLYGLKNPTVGTHNVVITWSAAPSGTAGFAISTTGGDTTTGWRSAFTRNDGAGAGPGLTVTDAVNGDLVFHVASVLAATIVFDGGEDTTSTELDNIAGNSQSSGLSTKPATGSTAVGTTDNGNYSEVAVAVIAAGGGGGASGRDLMLMGCGV